MDCCISYSISLVIKNLLSPIIIGTHFGTIAILSLTKEAILCISVR